MPQKHESAPTVSHLARREEEVQRPTLAVAEHVQLGVQAAFRASDRPWTIPFFSETGRSAVRLQECAVHHQGIALAARLRQRVEYPREDAHPGPAGEPVIQGLVGP